MFPCNTMIFNIVIFQFDLVCGREYFAVIASSVVFVGWTIGGTLLPYVSDSIGRKLTIFPVLATIITASCLAAAIKSVWVFIANRFIVGFALGGGSVTIFVLCSESVGASYRAIMCTIMWLHYAVALVFLALKAYYLQNWRLLELATTLPYALVLLTWRYYFQQDYIKILRVLIHYFSHS